MLAVPTHIILEFAYDSISMNRLSRSYSLLLLLSRIRDLIRFFLILTIF